MIEWIPFIVSFIFVFVSSYLLAGILDEKKTVKGFLYILLIAFSQIVLVFEVLSLFSQIKTPWVLTLQAIILVSVAIFWNKKSRPLWYCDFKGFLRQFFHSLKLDKMLIVLTLGFIFFISVSIFLCFVMPVVHADAWAYHVARSAFWAANGSLNHFDVPDIRNIVLPINSEILYSWVLLLTKKQVFIGFFSFAGFVMSMVALYSGMGLMGFSARKKLWVIFILSSFGSVLAQASTVETDIIIAGLITTGIFLFWSALKTNEKIPVFMSALAFALAVGTKTPTFFAIPTSALFMLLLCHKYKNFKFFSLFLAFSLLNFLIFSSYNYILNFIAYGNFVTNESFNQVSKNYEGFKGMVAGFIKHLFLLVDFSGFRWNEYIGDDIIRFRDALLNFLGVASVEYGIYNPKGVEHAINRALLEPLMGPGILGFTLFPLCLLWALIKPIFSRKTKTLQLFWAAFGFFLSVAVMSYLLVFMFYSTRFMIIYIVMAAPVLTYSYFSNKSPLKYIILAFAMFYFIFISTSLWGRPFFPVLAFMKGFPTTTQAREFIACVKTKDGQNEGCILRNEIIKYGKNNNYIIFLSNNSNILTPQMLNLNGYSVDFGLAENAGKIDLNKYNIVIAEKNWIKSALIKNPQGRPEDWKIVEVKGQKGLTAVQKDFVPCLYKTKGNQTVNILNNNIGSPIISVDCFMTNKFFQNRRLKNIATLEAVSTKYDVYENLNNPRKN